LGIFVEGFSIDAAVAVASGDDLDAFALLDLLASLVDKSLVIAEEDADEKRFRLLELTRAFALEKIAENNERALLAERHLRYLRDTFAARAVEVDRTGNEEPCRVQLGLELEDVRAALEWALANDHVEDGARILVDVSRRWLDYGLENEGIAWQEAYLAALRPDAFLLRALLNVDRAAMLDNRGLIVRTREIAPRALEDARASNDPMALARALYTVGWMYLRDNRVDDADRAISEAETIADPPIPVRLRIMEARAVICGMRADYDAAVRLFEEIRREHRACGNLNEASLAALNLANAEYIRGETRRAIDIAQEILPSVRNEQDTSRRGLLLGNLAGWLVAVDDLLGAAQVAREVIELLGGDVPKHSCVSLAIESLAIAYALIGDVARAALLAGYSDAALNLVGFSRDPGEQRGRDRLMALLRAALPAEELERMLTDGRGLEPAAAFTHALALAEGVQAASD
jgi:tetratricopeptide (TPR) repeat protein